jgi:NAD(P)H-dependent flavin oxidoreductase YrpB (nitropropane dioxygenase family)
MWQDKRAIDLLDIEHPILQAPMAGSTNPQLVAAVCGAGGLGGLGAAGSSPDGLRSAVREIRALTDRTFNVNLFNASTEDFDRQARLGPRLTELLASYHSEMGLGPIPDPIPLFGPAELQLGVLIEEQVPVIAAGGIMDARGIVACLALGASAVQLGTAFLGCPEAAVAGPWLASLETAEAEATLVTEALSGKPARGICNRYIEDLEAVDEALLPYPAQYSVSRELRKEAAKRGDPSFMAMWAGQGVGLFRRQPAAEFVSRLVADSQQLINRLAMD